ncbi:DNA mismatch repair protein MutT [Candidatus Francisella endociliophora]|uniref:8-oxo-dGTP diphosphatase n=1 Tax=Candidatus Francisella endociliophora TaxID=653937 RepID=A0A097ERQ0_9GAMM|nr:(deoxy)nucleoside triphosphate pyrophosphohydrolase [Francisella sp. FSC1006]AIT10251.1 DNA mismatch repair protein MutT [Francisella sp. FSC1006]
MAQIKAAVAIILNEDKSKVYISLRQKHQTYSNYWEFPGGKLENNETFDECVKRELYEEVGIEKCVLKPYISKKHINKDNIHVSLNFFIVEAYKGIPYPKENQRLQLINISELNNFKFLPASLEIIKKLQKDYL